MRQLVSLRTIRSITPHPYADRLEIAQIDGWTTIVPINTYREGEQVVYIEIDAAVPVDHPSFSWLDLRKTVTINDRKYHVIRTIRLRGVWSQGLIIPAPPDPPDDLADYYGIIKWEPVIPASMRHKIAGRWPSEIRRTDAERAQNITPEQWADIEQYAWYPTRKLDGQSVTVMNDDGRLRVCSRNYEIRPDGTLFDLAADLHAQLPNNTLVQAEYVGPGIQKNRDRLKRPDLRIFAYYNLDAPTQTGSRWRPAIPRFFWPEWVREQSVPILDLPFPTTPDDAIRQATSLPDHHEGIVWHTILGTLVPAMDDRECWKAINNNYLLGEK